MPKIIENLREKLIEETRRQVSVNGYEKVTMRSIARGCEVGLGTTYNYFKSKDMLIATFMLEDWEVCLQNIRAYSEGEKEPEDLLYFVYNEIKAYMELNKMLFEDESAKKIFAATFAGYHKLLRNQIVELIEESCMEYAKEPTAFLSEFVAEALVTWTTSGRAFEEIYDVLRPIFV